MPRQNCPVCSNRPRVFTKARKMFRHEPETGPMMNNTKTPAKELVKAGASALAQCAAGGCQHTYQDAYEHDAKSVLAAVLLLLGEQMQEDAATACEDEEKKLLESKEHQHILETKAATFDKLLKAHSHWVTGTPSDQEVAAEIFEIIKEFQFGSRSL